MNPSVSSGFLTAAHASRGEEVVTQLGSDVAQGLTEEVAKQRAQEVGYNELVAAAVVPAWYRFVAQFRELMVGILLAAFVISLVLGEWVDGVAILAIVLLNGILGFVQEERAQRSLAALRKLSSPNAKVIRGGELQALPVRNLVPGDIIEIEAGDHVPADARLISAFNLHVIEASLTGESSPTTKQASEVLATDAPLAERRNMLYMGTHVSAGKATAIVVATGMHTQLGNIATLLQTHENEPTPLQRRLAEVGRILIVLCLGIVAITLALQLASGQPIYEVFMLSVGLAVAAVPEGLPAVVTVALALGLQKMARRNALIRKLPSVETLGCVTVICSDKTGTLTRNEMTVREIIVGEEHFGVSGAGYEPVGQFTHLPDETIVPHQELVASDVGQLLQAAAWCNHAHLAPPAEGEGWSIVGDPTEGALVVVARKAGIDTNQLAGSLVFELPFDSERKAMSVLVRTQEQGDVLYTKGAPEVVLDKCRSLLRGGQTVPMTEDDRQQIRRSGAEMAGRALRVLAYATKPVATESWGEHLEQDLVFLGLTGMIDPPRDEAKQAVAKCRLAGIRPVMITGDHIATAQAIARELDIARSGETAMTGRELDDLSDDDLTQRVEQVSVYARVTAQHKLRIVKAWQRRDQVVAMTGDGVNDAPAVQAADIGIAMGISGTDVTKEASDMVLTDDNFTSIISAVEEGRGIFDNIQKFILYLLSSNASEVFLMFFAALVGWPSPLTAIQLLWINLVTDGLPALALAMERPEPDIMLRAPRPAREPVITRARAIVIVTHGLLIASVSVLGFWLFYRGEESNLPGARLAAFCIVAYAQLFYALSCRSQTYTMPELGPFSNPYLNGAILVSGLAQLGVVALAFYRPAAEPIVWMDLGWLWIALLALTPVTIIEVSKLIAKALRPIPAAKLGSAT